MQSQFQTDSSRKAYRLIFPVDLTEERVRAWLHAISGSMRVAPKLFGLLRPVVPSIVLETWADDQGYVHRLLAHPSIAGFIIEQLENLVPGITVEEDQDRPDYEWTVVTEIGMKSPSRTLNIPRGGDFAHSVMTSVQSLEEGQVALLQWVIAPKPREAPPAIGQPVQTNDFKISRSLMGKLNAHASEIEDRRRKLETPNYYALGRIAVVAKPKAAEALVGKVLNALSSSASHGNRLIKELSDPATASLRVQLARTPDNFPAQFSLNELSSVITWPIESPYVPGLPQSRTRHMHVNNSVPSSGPGTTVIGASNDKNKRDIGINKIDRMKHLHILGPTESGKTSEMTSIVEQDMKDGYCVVIIETKGDLFESALERVPENRRNKVIVWDLADGDWPIGFNLLDQGRASASIDELIQLISSMHPETITAPAVLYHALHALSEVEGTTLIDVPVMLQPSTPEEKQWRAEVVQSVKNPEIRKYWDDYLRNDPAKQDMESAALRRRLWQFVSRPEIRNSLGQSKSTFQMSDVVRDGMLLFINLNGVRIGQQAANIMGTYILAKLWESVRVVPHEQPVMLHMDEFQNFVAHSDSLKEIFAQARTFGLSLTVANQHLKQLRPDVIDALANARSKMVFQTTYEDARRMAPELGHKVRPEDLMNLQRREAIARVATSTGVSQPFTMRTKDISPPSANPRQIRQLSRQKYGRHVDAVRAETNERRKPTRSEPRDPRKRPNIGITKLTED